MKTNNKTKNFYYTAIWPLLPFQIAQNEAASRDIPDISKLSGTSFPIPRNYFLNNSRVEVFRRFHLLLRDFPFEAIEYKECDFLRPIQISSFQSGSSILNEMFNNNPGKCNQPVSSCKECIQRLYPLLPQRFDAQGLFASEFLAALVNNNLSQAGFKQDQYKSYWEKQVSIQSWAKDSIFWIAGENLFQASNIWWGKSGLEILREGGLFSPDSKNAEFILVRVSFFYDQFPDLVCAFFIDTKARIKSIRYIHGLTYAMKEARKSWLFDWVGMLSEAIMKINNVESFEFLHKYSHLKDWYEKFKGDYDESPDTSIKRLRIMYARESLEWMARVLAFLETSPEDASGDGDPKTFMDYSENMELAISTCLKETENSKHNNESAWKPFLSKNDPQGDNFKRSRARLQFIREFLEESTATINSVLDAKGVVKIKGSKSAALKAGLLRHVRLNPLTGKILLIGEPGGGKGLTAEQYHKLAIEEIKSKHHLLEKTIKEIWKRLLDILMLPKAREILDDFDEKKTETRLLGFVKAQVQGTKWWQWKFPGSLSEKKDSPEWPCGKNALCRAIIMVNGSDNNKFLDHHKFCDTCPLRLHHSYKPSESYLTYSIPSSISTKIIGDSVRFLLHYLARLMYAVYGIKNNAKPDVEQNHIQVLCGVLANQGPEFLSSMRRLFGTAEGVEMPLPGLFQTASYMGGTIFLDEIADAPIKIQDNLLGPLEEKKVNRLGWESIKEDVGNIRIIAATHKDLKARVKQFQSTWDSENPQGFRPDLLSRLILFPPVYPTSITEYFLYEDGDDEKRDLYRMEFISIMREILNNKSKDLKFPDDHRRSRFLNNLYNVVDRYIKNTMRMMDFSESQSPKIKKDLAGKITMRLFMGIIEEVILAEKQAEHLENTREKDGENKDQKQDKGPEKNENKPDFAGIVDNNFSSLKNDIDSALLQKDFTIFYDQAGRLIDQTINKQKNIPFDKQDKFKGNLRNAHKDILDIMKNTGEETRLPKAGSSFLDARLSDILAVNLPNLLNYIITSEV